LASSFFSKACDLYQPEAMSFMAKETFFHFKTLMTNDINRLAKDLGVNCKEKLKEFLEWFEKVAHMGLISMDQVEYLKKSDLFSFLPDEVMDLIKRREEIGLGDEDISKIILCSNRECHGIIDENVKGFFCKLCFKVLYCSRTFKSYYKF
jgi:hypothetical protein